MSRSRRKTPIIGSCTSSGESFYKAKRARRSRLKVRHLLHLGEYGLAKFEQAPWDEWVTRRDGKQMIDLSKPNSARFMRK